MKKITIVTLLLMLASCRTLVVNPETNPANVCVQNTAAKPVPVNVQNGSLTVQVSNLPPPVPSTNEREYYTRIQPSNTGVLFSNTTDKMFIIENIYSTNAVTDIDIRNSGTNGRHLYYYPISRLKDYPLAIRPNQVVWLNAAGTYISGYFAPISQFKSAGQGTSDSGGDTD